MTKTDYQAIEARHQLDSIVRLDRRGETLSIGDAIIFVLKGGNKNVLAEITSVETPALRVAAANSSAAKKPLPLQSVLVSQGKDRLQNAITLVGIRLL